MRILRVSNNDVLHHLAAALQGIAAACDTSASHTARGDPAPIITSQTASPLASMATDADSAAIRE